MADVQVSAHVSREVQEAMDRYANAHGVKKGALIEQALLHHLQALRELPADVIVPPQLVLTEASFAEAAKLATNPRKPTKAMRELMAPAKSKRRPRL